MFFSEFRSQQYSKDGKVQRIPYERQLLHSTVMNTSWFLTTVITL